MSEHVLDRLSAFLDEELPAREQTAVEGHLRDCSACAAHLDRLRSVDAQALGLPLSVPDGYFDALPGRIRKRLEKAPRRAYGRVPVWTWAVAAALVLGVVTPLTMQRSQRVPSEDAAAPMPPAEAAPAAAEPDPLAGVVARSEQLAPLDVGASRGKAKDDRAEPKQRKALADGTDTDRPAAAPPELTARLEAPAKKEADTLELAREREALGSRRLGPGGPYSQQQAPVQAPAAPAFADAPAEAPAPTAASPATERRADANAASRDEELAKLQEQALRPQSVGGAPVSGRVSSAVASSDERIFRLLQEATAPTTLAALRERREAWRSFTRDYPSSPRADEARVRVIQTGAEAWRVGADPADLARTREDAAAYLARRDAAQATRVRSLLESLPARP